MRPVPTMLLAAMIRPFRRQRRQRRVGAGRRRRRGRGGRCGRSRGRLQLTLRRRQSLSGPQLQCPGVCRSDAARHRQVPDAGLEAPQLAQRARSIAPACRRACTCELRAQPARIRRAEAHLGGGAAPAQHPPCEEKAEEPGRQAAGACRRGRQVDHRFHGLRRHLAAHRTRSMTRAAPRSEDRRIPAVSLAEALASSLRRTAGATQERTIRCARSSS